MAYEYEKENIRKLKSYNVLSGGANITKPIEELEEVYRKAKVLDEIYKYINRKLSVEPPHNDDYLIGRFESYETIKEFMEDKQND